MFFEIFLAHADLKLNDFKCKRVLEVFVMSEHILRGRHTPQPENGVFDVPLDVAFEGP